jgi:DNA repair exonuclease SbcCD nuclease subunit
MVRILATADWQVDALGGGLNQDARQHLSTTRINTIEKILEVAKKENIDHILAAGDLFEYPKPTQEAITSTATILQRHHTIPIHAIPGNHDLFGPGSVWNTPEFKAISHFHLYKEKECIELTNGVFLHPIPVKNKFSTERQDELLEDVSEETGIHIVMAHAHDVAYMDFSDHENDCNLPIDSGNVLAKGFDLLILGHWHSWNEIVKNRVIYPGTHEQTKFGERDAGYVAIIDIPEDGGEPSIERRKVGQIRWSSKSFDCTDKELPDELIDFVRDASEDTDFLKLELTGEIDLDLMVDAIPRAKQACGPFMRHLEIDDQKLTSRIDVEEMMDKVDLPVGLREIQNSILSELEVAQGNDATSNALHEELQALYRACREAGIVE